jgi:hypothetical protein
VELRSLWLVLGGVAVLRNPYITGVERFEVPLANGMHVAAAPQRKEQAALFCLLLWEQFQRDLRAIRYIISFDHTSDTTLEFNQRPRYDDLVTFDTNGASQIDIECISQQAALTPKDLPPHIRQKEDHYPLLFEVFIPLDSHPVHQDTAVLQSPAARRLVVWSRPNLLPEITALWERASARLSNQTS